MQKWLKCPLVVAEMKSFWRGMPCSERRPKNSLVMKRLKTHLPATNKSVMLNAYKETLLTTYYKNTRDQKFEVTQTTKTHFYLSNEYKMNIKQSQDIEEVINNDCYIKY